MMLPKSSYVSVNLLEPTIYIEPNSDNFNVVRGTVNINLPRTTTVKSISVRFDGVMETKGYTFASVEAGAYAQRKPLARQRLVLYPNLLGQPEETVNRPLVMNAGLTQFGFEMQIPSKLPETIECSDIKVNYNVTAVLEYYSRNSSTASTLLQQLGRTYNRGSYNNKNGRYIKAFAKQPIRVARLPYCNLLLGDSMADPIDSRTHRSRWLNYQILINKKAVALGSDLPITFRLTPADAEDEVTMDRVSIQMLERRDLFRSNSTPHTSHSIFTIQPSANNQLNGGDVLPLNTALTAGHAWEGTVYYSIPENKALSHSTQEYSEFNISHTLLISITLSVPGGSGRFTSSRVQKTLSFQTHIDILDETVGELEAFKLPTYDAPPSFDEAVYGLSPSQQQHVCLESTGLDRKFSEFPPSYEDISTTTRPINDTVHTTTTTTTTTVTADR
ncbi:hypothetical protein BDF20DRAFT_851507 [Mycotypha africana]|uniref:uncharacterized protein n=1 Tax=Mycotypha africana TaxID=64632 RepID=UPI0023015288|nr:uncharacterized protein BDF20DRAFT_851507 [Mycotypha africana]KAI8987659.1 hypothetical protein BDF20DRAFT_851507 [Mycotypha africana]